MSDRIIEEIINKLNMQLKKSYTDFKGLYFYGSRAAGKGAEDSDYDIVFMFERKKIDRSLKDEIINLVYDYELENDIIIDVRVYTFQSIQNPNTPFRLNVKTEGVFYGV